MAKRVQGKVSFPATEFFEWFAQGDLMEVVAEFTNGLVPADVDEVIVSQVDNDIVLEYHVESL